MSGLLAELFSIEADFTVDPAVQRRGLQLLVGRRPLLRAGGRGRGPVIGMVTLQVLISTAEGGPVGLLEDLVVGDG